MNVRLVGKRAPGFTMDAVMADGSLGKVSLEENMELGKWTILLFYPMAFGFVCPTELTMLSERYGEFKKLNAEIIGISTDTVHTLSAWVNTKRMANGVGRLRYPLASDTNHSVSRNYGVLIEEEGFTLRGLFIICPEGDLRYQTVFYDHIGRDVDEILRVVQTLQNGGLHPVNWKPE